jgi:aryl-alcohol dehydrogenase
MQITAAVARNPHSAQQRFCVEVLELESPREDEVLVRIVGTGVCHSDILVVDQVLPVPLPAVLGHEGSGIVEAVGAKVTKVKPGDHVVLTFNFCGTCERCVNGEPAYCLNFQALNFAGMRPDGSRAICSCGKGISSNFFGQSSFASHALANERNVVKVSQDAPLELLGPLGCGVQTGAGAVMRALAAEAGSTIAIFGAGPVGLSAVMGAVVQGCSTIILVEPIPSRRALALELGATHVIDPTAGNAAEQIRAILPSGVKYAVDTSGVVPAIAAASQSLAVRGKLAIVGVPSNPEAMLPVNIIGMLVQGMSVISVVEGDSVPDDFIPELVRLHAAGRFPLEKIMKTYPFGEINQAVADQIAGACVKAVVVQ